MKRYFTMIAVAVLALSGCSNIGPKTVPRDRFDYNTAISRSWKEQTLLNIVKLRYADMPLFVEVASVVSGYTLEGSVNLGGTVSSKSAIQGDFLALGTGGKYTDRPTITYAPITGARFNSNFMTPIPPSAILFLLQNGWPADMVFPITVDSINGLRSKVFGGASIRSGDQGFYDLIDLLLQMQKAGALGMRIIKEKNEKQTTVIFFHKKNLSPEMETTVKKIAALLNLSPSSKEIKVVYGVIPQDKDEMAIQTRSLIQIMIQLATQIDVPPHHVTKGWTIPSSVPPDDIEGRTDVLIKVRTSTEKPEEAFVAVQYEDTWFWIAKGDFKSKRTFAFLMILFSLTETGGKEGLPLVTIPAG